MSRGKGALSAVLSADGTFVLCGRCATQLARIESLIDRAAYDAAPHFTKGWHTPRAVILDRGWMLREDVYEYVRSQGPRLGDGRVPQNLPIRARCPACHSVQVIDSGALATSSQTSYDGAPPRIVKRPTG